MSAIAPSLAVEFPPDRRHRARIDGAGLLLFCDLGDANGGLVLDISKSGLGLQSVKPVPRDDLLKFGIEMPNSALEVAGEAQVVWSQGTRAGLRFTPNCRGVDALCKELDKTEQAIHEQDSFGALPAAPDLPVLLGTSAIRNFLQQLVQKTGADGGALAVLENGFLFCRESWGAAPPIGTEVNSTCGLTGECFKTKSLVYCADTADDRRVNSVAAARMNVRAAIVLPCEFASQSGLIELFSSSPGTLVPQAVLRHVHDLLAVKPSPASKSAPSRRTLPFPSQAETSTVPVEKPSEAKPNEIESLGLNARESDASLAEGKTWYSSIALGIGRHKFHVGAAVVLAILCVLGIRAHGDLHLTARSASPSHTVSQVTVAPRVVLPTSANIARPSGHLAKLDSTRHVPKAAPSSAVASEVALDLESHRVPPVPHAITVDNPEPPALSLAPAPTELLIAPPTPPSPPASTGYWEGKLLFQVKPTYPAAAAGKTGSVTVQIKVAENGMVTAVKIVRSDDPLFSAAAMAATTRWRYAPSVLDGHPVSVEHLITFNFKFQS